MCRVYDALIDVCMCVYCIVYMRVCVYVVCAELSVCVCVRVCVCVCVRVPCASMAVAPCMRLECIFDQSWYYL